MTIVGALQWPLYHLVWPLLLGRKIAKARKLAQTIAEAGELRIQEWYQRVGYIRMLIYSQEVDRLWYINIRPVHFGGLWDPVYEFSKLKHVEFKYCPKGVTDRYPWDYSTYLTIKNVR